MKPFALILVAFILSLVTMIISIMALMHSCQQEVKLKYGAGSDEPAYYHVFPSPEELRYFI